MPDTRLRRHLGEPKNVRVNERGNRIEEWFWSADRYVFDFELAQPTYGWRQYDTDQDAWYYGVWVHIKRRLTLSYCEGDIYLCSCPSIENFKAELESMAEFYGDAPPAAIGIAMDGTITHYFDKRPTAEENENGPE